MSVCVKKKRPEERGREEIIRLIHSSNSMIFQRQRFDTFAEKWSRSNEEETASLMSALERIRPWMIDIPSDAVWSLLTAIDYRRICFVDSPMNHRNWSAEHFHDHVVRSLDVVTMFECH